MTQEPIPSPRATPEAPAGPRFFERLWRDPNPVWMRELKQAARLQRTPIILAVVTGMMTLLICSVGGVASTTAEPAKVGVGVFHTFFSLAFAVVTWLGPAVAANTIAGERGGRTWEALQLTGLSPKAIAKGKFLAAFTYISLYIVMLVPVGALPFLFGGVTATEVLIAFVLLFLLAALAVAFGLSVSAKFSSPSAAIIVTLLVALPVSLVAYGAGGVGLSFLAHQAWPGVPSGPPVWLPTAYVRADFSSSYVVFLLLLPAVTLLIPAWLFYEVTVANISSPSDDRSTRLRVWFLCALPAVILCTSLVVGAGADLKWLYTAGALIWACGCFGAFLFAAEPLAPSQRVLARFQRKGRSRLRRALGPGIINASLLLLGLTLLGMASNTGIGLLIAKNAAERAAVLAFHGYAAAFLGFVVGFTAWARARARTLGTPRALLSLALFLAFVGPWIAMAIAGLLSDEHGHAILMAGPSPTFALALAQALSTSEPDAELMLVTGGACALAWALIGVGLFAAARSRIAALVNDDERARMAVQRAFAAEDLARESATEKAAEFSGGTPSLGAEGHG